MSGILNDTLKFSQAFEALAQEIKIMKQVQSSQGMMLSSLGADVSQFKYLIRRQGIMCEDLEYRLAALTETTRE